MGKSKKESARLQEAPEKRGTLPEMADGVIRKGNLKESTQTAYRGQVAWCRDWLQKATVENLGISESQSEEYRRAFDDTPNRYSAHALVNVITHKCQVEGRKKGTMDQVYSAFKHLWQFVPGDVNGRYRAGNGFTIDDASGEVYGNPAEHPQVQVLLKSFNNLMRHDDRYHSDAMRYPHMVQIHGLLAPLCFQHTKESWEALSLQEREQYNVNLWYMGLSTLAFNLWTRVSEVTGIQRSNIDFNCISKKAPFVPIWEVVLEDRKGSKLGRGANRAEEELQGYRYGIHSQKMTPAIDCDHWTRLWIAHMEMVIGRSLAPDNFIFPLPQVHSKLDPSRQCSHDFVQKHVTSMALAAGIEESKHFTTHCFRRGGVQYRFLDQEGRPWDLPAVIAWGGWKEGEHKNTLLHYVMDEKWRRDQNYSDAMRPIQPNLVSHGGPERLPTFRDLQALQLESEVRVVNALRSLVLSSPTPNAVPQPANYPSQLPLPLPAPPPPPGLPVAEPNDAGMLTGFDFPEDFPQGMVIPNIESGREWWVKWHRDWVESSEERGLKTALKDWKPTWYSGKMKPLFGQKYHNRKVVAEEFESCKLDSAAFKAKWPTSSWSKFEEAKKRRGIKEKVITARASRKRAKAAREEEAWCACVVS